LRSGYVQDVLLDAGELLLVARDGDDEPVELDLEAGVLDLDDVAQELLLQPELGHREVKNRGSDEHVGVVLGVAQVGGHVHPEPFPVPARARC
jgi:hypothetical protein